MGISSQKNGETIPIDTKMKANNIHISVGIPAYNEYKNIKKLLKQVLHQEPGQYIIDKIIVISDGSTDSTVEQAKSLRSRKIKVVNSSERLGKAERMNQLFKISESEVLILIDADCGIAKTCFKNFAEYYTSNKVCLVASNTKPYKPENFVQKSLYFAMNSLKEATESDTKVSVYSFRGSMIGICKNLYKKIKVPSVAGTDAFLYFSAVKLKSRFGYSRNSVVYYRLPKTIKDHIKQSSRFIASRENMANYFGSWVYRHYEINKSKYVRTVLIGMVKQPLYSIFYMLLRGASRIKATKNKGLTHGIWEISGSTKK